MIIDIFVYSNATASAAYSIHSLIEAGKCARLDGIAVTDRASSCHARENIEAGRRSGFLVLSGVEFETPQGRITAYPAQIDDEYVSEDWRCLGDTPAAADVLEYFHARGGIVIARDVFNRGEGLKDSVYHIKDSNGRGFDGVDTIAVYRRRIDNELSIEAQQVLGVPACAGSGIFDDLQDIGHCATLFTQQITDQASFVSAMRAALHWACSTRDMGEACPMGSAPKSEDSDVRDERSFRNRRGNDERRGSGRGRQSFKERRGGHGRNEEESHERHSNRKPRGQNDEKRHGDRRPPRGGKNHPRG